MKFLRAGTFLLGAFIILVLGLALNWSMLFIAAGLVAMATLLNRPTERLCVTLSVPEILMDVMDAFKIEVPFMVTNFATDFSSKTAVKGDKITAHISTLPTIQTYDATNGFNNNPANADALLTDVSVTLNNFYHVPVKVNWLTQLSSKMPLYREAIRNIGYVMAKKVVDDALALVVAANFSNTTITATANVNLDQIEAYRSQCNTQKMARRGRFGICNTTFSAALQNDDRVKSALFYGQLNGDEGYRHFRNLAGFGDIWEYPDFPANGINLSAFFADRRAIVIANRRIDFSNAAAELKVPQIMSFWPMSDPDTGLQMTGVGWQQPGTGDVYVSCAILYGLAAGKGGSNGCDSAGFYVTSS